MTATAVYRFYDTAGVLLYVGITVDPWLRFASHEDVAWAKDADLSRVRVRWYETRRAAKAAESRAIETEQPVYNLAEKTRAACHPPTQPALPCDCSVHAEGSLDEHRRSQWFAVRWNAGRRLIGGWRGKGAIVPCRVKTVADVIAELDAKQLGEVNATLRSAALSDREVAS
jgi:predicted GIY-YIG superfamily endonuclease